MTARLLTTAMAVLLAGCITVNIYFPAPEVRRAAEEIVDETWGSGGGSNAATPAADKTTSWLQLLSPAAAHAQQVDINVSTAAIRTLKDQMKARAGQLKPYLDRGSVGISKGGMLEVRNLDGVSLKDQATVRRLVEAENSDRESLYQEIAKANNFGADRIDDIRTIFAETWVQKAEPGWWVQSSSGAWAKK
jgi:uncharacterized protein YdbL (DUF1318 family)